MLKMGIIMATKKKQKKNRIRTKIVKIKAIAKDTIKDLLELQRDGIALQKGTK